MNSDEAPSATSDMRHSRWLRFQTWRYRGAVRRTASPPRYVSLRIFALVMVLVSISWLGAVVGEFRIIYHEKQKSDQRNAQFQTLNTKYSSLEDLVCVVINLTDKNPASDTPAVMLFRQDNDCPPPS